MVVFIDNINFTIDKKLEMVRTEEKGKIIDERWGAATFDKGQSIDWIENIFVQGDIVYVSGFYKDVELDEHILKAVNYNLDGSFIFSSGDAEEENSIYYAHLTIPTSQGLWGWMVTAANSFSTTRLES